MPDRFGVDAEQTAAVGVEVRRMIFERTYLMFYSVERRQQQVTVVSFRHGAQRGP